MKLDFKQGKNENVFILKTIDSFICYFHNFALLYNHVKNCIFTHLFLQTKSNIKNEYRTVCEPSHFPQ